jgi:hypothetical protein
MRYWPFNDPPVAPLVAPLVAPTVAPLSAPSGDRVIA